MAGRLAELVLVALAAGFLLGCARSTSDESGSMSAADPTVSSPSGAGSTPPAPTATTTGSVEPGGSLPLTTVAGTGSATTSPSAPPGTTAPTVASGSGNPTTTAGAGTTASSTATPVADPLCAAAAGLARTGPGALLTETGAFLAEIRRLAGDLSDPTGADTRLRAMIPTARALGGRLLEEATLHDRVARTANGDRPLADAAASIRLAEVAVGQRLAGVERIDDLVVAAALPSELPPALRSDLDLEAASLDRRCGAGAPR